MIKKFLDIDDKEVVLEAVKNYGYVLQFASERLKNDREVVKKLLLKRID